MKLEQIKTKDLKPEEFIPNKIQEIKKEVKDNSAVSILSGGVDSSVATILANKALGDQLSSYFIENGLMRKGEAEQVKNLLDIKIKVIDAKQEFFAELKGITDPESKRKVITLVFYKKVLKKILERTGANFVIQGTNYTDVEETVKGIKSQHNVIEQLGIDSQQEYGYEIVEPVVQLRKDGIRKIARFLDLPEQICSRMPFPGPALATRIIGEVTPVRVELVRQATAILEQELAEVDAFQYMAILHQDKVTGLRNNQRQFGNQIEIRCWNSVDATIASPTKLPWGILRKISNRITAEIPKVVSVTYNISKKPPSTMEAI